MPYEQSTLQLLHILVAEVESREVTSLASLRPYENTAIVTAFKVSLAPDGAIVLARGLIEGDPDPEADARDLGHCTDVRHSASSSVRFREEAYATRE
jgi:hypothetical protein